MTQNMPMKKEVKVPLVKNHLGKNMNL